MTVSVGFLNSEAPRVNFRLTQNFLNEWKNVKPDFGFNGLGEITYLRTYSRLKDDGTKEEWWETIKRVVEGTYSIQKRHIANNGLYWNENKARRSAEEMYKYMFEMKFLPPGRGLWAMGTDIIEVKQLFEALNNCAMVSTDTIDKDPIEPFTFMMAASMLGTGVGFDTKGEGLAIIYYPSEIMCDTFTIPDTREGWVTALNLLLTSYLKPNQNGVDFNYDLIRSAGLPLKVFGGFSSGYEPLEYMLETIRTILKRRDRENLTETDITDIMNVIGVCVVAGGIRRTAQIAFGSSDEFINLKNFEMNPERQEHGWASNNSYFAETGDDYGKVADLTREHGEPGYFWLENAQKFGRMGRNWNEKYMYDHRACGGNPCLEQTLESYEMCCLVETFPNRCEDFEEYQKVLKYAYLYAKTVTLGRTQWTRTNEVMLRNRRIGTSMSGVAQFVEQRGLAKLQKWMDKGYKSIEAYDIIYSEWFKIPTSIKITSIKPSGTVSLLAGATPGVHYPESRYYLRRMTINKHDPTLAVARSHGVDIEPHLMWSNDKEKWIESDRTVQAVFPIDSGMDKVKPSMYEQLELAAFMQEWWADNQVSVTVSFDPDTEGDLIERALEFYQFRLKGVSFLPRKNLSKNYPQLPYEAISKKEYHGRIFQQKARQTQGFYVKDVSAFDKEFEDAVAEAFCTTDVCLIPSTE